MSAIVRYCEHEARLNTFRYMLEQNKLRHEAFLRWIHENRFMIDVVFTTGFFLYVGWCALSCYRRWFPVTEAPMDKQRLRTELVNIEHAIAALNDHRTCIMLKLKRD